MDYCFGTSSAGCIEVRGRVRGVLGGAIGSLFILSFVLHFWGLGGLHSLVFDEIYYVPFAINYLSGEPFFDAHPPLGKYLIAIGIALGERPAAWLQWPTLQLGNQLTSPLSYRWLNALVGSTLPGIAALLGFYLSADYGLRRRLIFALMAGVLVLLSGLPLVESRLALINIYWVWFGLLGQLCWAIADANQTLPQVPGHGLRSGGLDYWRMGSGVLLGAAMNVKWNGAGFWLGLVLVELLGKGRSIPAQSKPSKIWSFYLVYLGLVPLVTYSLLWIPHLRLNQVSLFEIHRQLWSVHQGIAANAAPHPYCSAWYTWPLMLRPVSYLYEFITVNDGASILTPLREPGPITHTVQGMGNPLLWWLSTAAIVALGAGWGGQQIRRYRARRRGRGHYPYSQGGQDNSIQRPLMNNLLQPKVSPVVCFVLVNYMANWLPWMVVSRCTFLYHAQGMLMFADLALAWLLSRWLIDRRWHRRLMGGIMLVIVLWGFWFWWPVFIGLPLSPDALQHRWWLRSWI